MRNNGLKILSYRTFFGKEFEFEIDINEDFNIEEIINGEEKGGVGVYINRIENVNQNYIMRREMECREKLGFRRGQIKERLSVSRVNGNKESEKKCIDIIKKLRKIVRNKMFIQDIMEKIMEASCWSNYD